MEECMRKKELEGKELNPETCTFVKKCPPGKVRNSKGKCVKGSTSKQNGTQAPRGRRTRREIINEYANQWTNTRGQHKATAVKFNRHKPTKYSVNNYKRGPPNPRLRKQSSLYGNPEIESSYQSQWNMGEPGAVANYSKAWPSGISELRNSLNLENQKRGIVQVPKVRKHKEKKPKNENEDGISLDLNNEDGPRHRLTATNNIGLVFNAAHNGKPKLLRKIKSAKVTKPEVEDEANEGLLQMFEAQQPPVKLEEEKKPNTRRLQRRKAKNKERMEAAAKQESVLKKESVLKEEEVVAQEPKIGRVRKRRQPKINAGLLGQGSGI